MPAGFGLSLDVSASQLRDDLWFGGAPPRVLRLTETGRRAWDELRDGGRVASPASAVLARRLTDAGLAHPVPPTVAIDDVTVIVPAHDRVADLDRCLAALGSDVPVVVVDDASREGAQVARICATHGATLVRRDGNGGPGAARNTGLAHAQSEFVAFVDSDCTPPRGWLAPLLAHLADPLVAAVAPRIVGVADDSWAGRYTAERGSLDLGDLPARVMPRSRITYVPSAALVVRRAALDDVGAFDETLRVGEDVDLVWRLAAAGWRIRYDPSVHVMHREPATWPQLLSRRYRYGTSAGPLARRHPEAISPLVLHPWPTITVAAALARRPLVAAGAAGIGAATMARALRAADVPTTGLLPAMANGVRQTWLGLGRYLTQFAAPALFAALCSRRTRLAATALLLGPPLAAWAPRRVLDPVRFTLGSLADEVAYGTGVWVGSARARTLRAARPVVAWRPLRSDTRRS
jgi:mycofactocin system glycosyltransferase